MYLVNVHNKAGDLIEHPEFDDYDTALKYADERHLDESSDVYKVEVFLKTTRGLELKDSLQWDPNY